MSVVLRSVDFTPIAAAIKNDDGATFTRVAGELGLELSLDTFRTYVQRHLPSDFHGYLDLVGTAFFKLAYAALHERAIYDTLLGVTLLVVRDDARLVVGIQQSQGRSKPFPKGGWAIGRWYKDPAKNRPTVAAWAADPARERDALAVPIVRPPDAVAASDTRGDALLAAVIANPDDDGARLVYADWLVEQGDVRGELIRVQCELASPDLAPDRSAALRAREQEILASAGKGMRAAVETFAERATIQRGLVEHVEIRVVKLAKYGAELVAKHPICALCVIVASPEEFARLGTLPFLARIPELQIEARKTPRIMMSRVALKPSSLAQSPVFATTKRLRLSYLDDDTAEWERFFTAFTAPELETLSLVHPGFAARALARLAARPRSLALHNPTFARASSDGDEIVEAIGTLHVEELVLSSWGCGDHTIARCVRALRPAPVSLSISYSSVNDSTIAAICEHGDRLERLTLANRDTPIAPVKRLLAHPFPKLRELEVLLRAPPDADPIVEALLAQPALERVRFVDNALPEPHLARLRERVRVETQLM